MSKDGYALCRMVSIGLLGKFTSYLLRSNLNGQSRPYVVLLPVQLRWIAYLNGEGSIHLGSVQDNSGSPL